MIWPHLPKKIASLGLVWDSYLSLKGPFSKIREVYIFPLLHCRFEQWRDETLRRTFTPPQPFCVILIPQKDTQTA